MQTLRRKRQRNGAMLCLALIFLSGCVAHPALSCRKIETGIEAKSVLDIIKRTHEFTRSDGSRYTIANLLSITDVEILDCHDKIKVTISPAKSLPDGGRGIGETEIMIIDPRTMEVVHSEYF